MTKLMYAFVVLAIISGFVSAWYAREIKTDTPEAVVPVPSTGMCTMDAQQCPDGSFVGRTGPQCEFVCPETGKDTQNPGAVVTESEVVSDMIEVTNPTPGQVVTSGMILSGKARSGWYFEGSFPVSLVNWDGLIIAELPAVAASDWMTPEFVSFSVPINFVLPYKPGDPEFMKRGTLILHKDNPSGLPENDAALEIPVRFAP